MEPYQSDDVAPLVHLMSRLQAIDFGIASLENAYARLLDTYTSLPLPSLSTDPRVSASALELCAREFTNNNSDYFRILPGTSRVVEASALRAVASSARNQVNCPEYQDAEPRFSAAERQIDTYWEHISSLQTALEHLERAAQHRIQAKEVARLEDVIEEMAATYASLRERYHALPPCDRWESPPDGVSFSDQILVDEAFGEPLLEPLHAFDIPLANLQAVVGQADTAVLLLYSWQADAFMEEAQRLETGLRQYLRDLTRAMEAHEAAEGVGVVAGPVEEEDAPANEGSASSSAGEEDDWMLYPADLSPSRSRPESWSGTSNES